MRILVTGANGYIGSKVVKKLLDMKHIVIATDFEKKNIDEKAIFVKSDLFDIKGSLLEFFHFPDICIHLAWRDGFIHNSINHILDLSSHYRFINRIVEDGIKKIVVMGTMHEVGYFEGMIKNDTPTNPLNLYGIVKDTLRKSIMLNTKINEKLIWLRAFYIYGNDDNNPSVFGKLVSASKKQDKYFPINSGTNKYDFIHIDTLVYYISICSLQEKYFGIINCCSGKPISLAEKLEEYIKVNNLNIQLDYGKYPDRAYDSPIVYGDDKIIKDILKEQIK